jgi:hypothetical protein
MGQIDKSVHHKELESTVRESWQTTEIGRWSSSLIKELSQTSVQGTAFFSGYIEIFWEILHDGDGGSALNSLPARRSSQFLRHFPDCSALSVINKYLYLGDS